MRELKRKIRQAPGAKGKWWTGRGTSVEAIVTNWSLVSVAISLPVV